MSTKRRQPKPKPAVLVVMNLAEMGPKPDWQAVQGFFGSLQPPQRAVLLHWLAFHLGTARAAHEDNPRADAAFRDYCSGSASQVSTLMMELRALLNLEGERAGKALVEYFGGKKPAAGSTETAEAGMG